ncbi:MAG: hypothetical protein QM651_13720 [Rhodoblastus sp.]
MMAKKRSGPAATFTVLGQLRFDGDLYQPGDTVDLTADVSAELLAAGVIEPAPAAAADDKKPAAPAK